MFQVGYNQYVLMDGEVQIFIEDKTLILTTKEIRIIQNGQETVVPLKQEVQEVSDQ